MAIQDDGFATLISIAGTTLFEKEVTPPGFDGGEAIPISTMRNTLYHTKAPRTLIDLTDINFTAAYDPLFYTSLLASINVNQAITITFPNTGTLVIWGWLKNITPDGSTEGGQPTAQCTIVVSNVDAAGAEIAPAYTAPA